MNIVIPDKLDLYARDREKLAGYGNIKIYDDVINEPAVIIKRIQGAGIITANFIDLTAEIIEASPDLKYVISPAVGYDWIDVKKATAKGIKVINCPTYNTYAVAEHAIGLIFAVYRHIVAAQLSILNGEWKSTSFTGNELRGKSILTIGYGNVGKNVLKLAEALGMHAKYANSSTPDNELLQMLSEADVVVLCYPLNDKTRGSFNRQKIDTLKKEAVLINVSRGLILNQDYLFSVLKEKKIFGAGLDVFNNDQTLTEAREDIIAFAKLPNVVTTPHIGFNTFQTRERLGIELLKNIDAILANHPINIING